MRNRISLVFFALFFCCFNKGFSQTEIENNPNLITHTHFYSYKGNSQTTKATVNELQEDLKKCEFVKEVIIKYTDDKKAGYIKVITQEKPVTKEGDKSFSPAVLKNMLLKHKLSPIVYTIENGIK